MRDIGSISTRSPSVPGADVEVSGGGGRGRPARRAGASGGGGLARAGRRGCRCGCARGERGAAVLRCSIAAGRPPGGRDPARRSPNLREIDTSAGRSCARSGWRECARRRASAVLATASGRRGRRHRSADASRGRSAPGAGARWPPRRSGSRGLLGDFAAAGAAALVGATGSGRRRRPRSPPPPASTGTMCPSSARISEIVPAAGLGISASTLSVEISNSGWSRSTASPTCFSHR